MSFDADDGSPRVSSTAASGDRGPFEDDDGGGFPSYDSHQHFESYSSFSTAAAAADVGGSSIGGGGGGGVGDGIDVGSPVSYGSRSESAPAPFASASGNHHADEDDIFASSDEGPLLPPPTEMQAEEGFVLREWRRQNAIHLEEKEQKEREMQKQIILEAEEYKKAFYEKRRVNCETNKNHNREREKIFLSNQENFHANADEQCWKAIAELIPREVPNIEKRRGKKEQEKKPSVVVMQGPKPGKPTDLSRMHQILVKLKATPPSHMIPPPPAPAAKDSAAAPAGKDGKKPATPAKAAAAAEYKKPATPIKEAGESSGVNEENSAAVEGQEGAAPPEPEAKED